MEGRRLTTLLAHLSSGPVWNSASRVEGIGLDLETEINRPGTSESVRVSPWPVAQPLAAHSITSPTVQGQAADLRPASTMHETASSQLIEKSERTFSFSHCTICIEGLSPSWSETSVLAATNNEASMQCKDLAEVAVRECPVEHANQTVRSTDEHVQSCRNEVNDHEARDCECQAHAKTSDNFENQVHQNHLLGRDMHTTGSHSAEIELGTSESTTLSRNNVMTGQRSLFVDDCIFCLIVQGQSPAFKLYEDDMCVCILDVHPLSHGHSLLIPKAHFPCLELTPPEVAAAMCAIVPFLSMAIMQATSCDSFNLLVNSGKAAGQVVFHTHFHIIPRRSGDNLWRSEDSKRRALPVGHETSLLVQQIRHHLSKQHT